nr:chromodomain-helicase-DNA-binding protein 7-like isoform X1 [Ipomoea batatas]GMD25342.1 chromodomain-helicase-DNA-binding protein 7-like isoform X1 [Ipomoea batatas]
MEMPWDFARECKENRLKETENEDKIPRKVYSLSKKLILRCILADLDTRRAKALAHYRNEVERIVNISEGAKRQAEQNGYTNASV